MSGFWDVVAAEPSRGFEVPCFGPLRLWDGFVLGVSLLLASSRFSVGTESTGGGALEADAFGVV